MVKNLLKRILAATLTTSMLIPGLSSLSAIAANAATVDYGVGKGITWDAQVNAPYVDMVAWVTKAGYANNGAPNLLKLSQDTGVKYFNLAFIQSLGNVSNGKVNWGWGGYSVLKEGSSDNQYQGIKKSIKDLRANGGDVAISFGGAAGTAFWQTTTDVNVLAATYTDIVQGYGLTRIDLDIEGAGMSLSQNVANAKAIKLTQDATKVDVVLTLPVLPSGLTQEGLNLLQAYLENGVKLKVVNIMTMCYGDGVLLPGEDYGTASVRAMNSLKDQLKSYYKTYANTTLTDADAYGKIGTTCSVGFESGSYPVFTTGMTKTVVDASIKNKTAMTSMWSLNRDAQLETNSGVTSQYQFTNVYKAFVNGGTNPPLPETNTAPVLNGVKNSTITVGDSFNPLANVTATDKEDGDLTNKIVVTGSVNTQVAGNYSLTYSVTDSKGLVASAKAVVTVNQKTNPPTEDAYDATKIYNTGDTVVYNGQTYRANWWTKGETPSSSAAWTLVVAPNGDGSVNYVLGKAYTGGTVVKYNGVNYKANWWTNSTPGSDSSWTKVS